jgi:hypothetical protein
MAIVPDDHFLGGVMQQRARNALVLSVGAALCCIAARGALANKVDLVCMLGAMGSPATMAALLQIDIYHRTLSGPIKADPGSVRVTRSYIRWQSVIASGDVSKGVINRATGEYSSSTGNSGSVISYGHCSKDVPGRPATRH